MSQLGTYFCGVLLLLISLELGASPPLAPRTRSAPTPAWKIPPPPRHGEGELELIRCLLKRDARACRYAYSSASDKLTAFQIAQVGCLELGAPVPCNQLMESYPVRDPEKIQAYSAQLCDQEVMGACYLLLKNLRASVDNTDSPIAAEALAPATALPKKICAKQGQDSDLCLFATQMSSEMARRNDAAFHECVLDYRFIHDRDSLDAPAQSQQVAEPHVIANLVPHESCRHKCGVWFSGLTAKPSSEFMIRGRCLWGGHLEGASFSHQLQAETCKPSETSILIEDQAFYEECYCLQLMVPELNEVADRFNVYPVAKVSHLKRMGSKSWYRCVQGLHYASPEVAHRDSPACRQNLTSLKQALSKISNLSYDLDFSSIDCAGNARPTASSRK